MQSSRDWSTDAMATLLAEPADRRVGRWPVAGLRTIAHLVAKSRGRCGIYVLAFDNGEFYVGQAVDVTARFVTHAQTYSDIVEVFFWPVSRPGLDQVEQGEIHRLQRSGVLLRNVVHASGRLGASAFDTLFPPDEQQRWLIGAPTDHFGAESRPDEPGVRRRGRLKFQKLAADPRTPAVLPALRRYLAWTMPAARRTELAYWTVSAVPATSKSYRPRLLTLSVQHLETFIVDAPAGEPGRTRIRVNVDTPTLLARWGTLDRLMDANPGIYAWTPGYDRPDVTSLEVESARQLRRLLAVEAVVPAARRLNLDLMRKGPTLHWQSHNFPLADVVFAHPVADLDQRGADGVGLTLAKRADDALADGNLERAERHLIAAADAGYTPALVDLGWLCADLDRPADAERWLVESVAAGETRGHLRLGDLYRFRGELDLAAQAYRQAAAAGEPTGLVGLGLLQTIQGEPAEATAWYRKAAELGSGEAMCLLGDDCFDDGRNDEAERLYVKALSGGFDRAHLHLGDLYFNRGRFDAARRHYRQAAGAGFGEGFAVLGSMHEQAGEPDRAEQLYRQAVAHGDATALVDLGLLLIGSDRPDEGLQCLHQAADAGDDQAMLHLGEHHEAEGDHEAADVWYRRAVDAGNPDATERRHRLKSG
ncbi:tetratricopeptide repeat protein [Dactylosporangium sp. NPDC051541]|uniref:tetratricopeptide repeat protein n=1 Tax=Dactylosporangium sp. NPDC051541 TaxID=3363977 RepID=UPI0037ABD4B6